MKRKGGLGLPSCKMWLPQAFVGWLCAWWGESWPFSSSDCRFVL